MDRFYDICIFNPEEHEEMIARLKEFGFGGAYFCIDAKEKKQAKEYAGIIINSEEDDFDTKICMLKEALKPGDIANISPSGTGIEPDISAVKGLTEDAFRKAAETKKTDMITGLISAENRLLIDYITVNFCRENNIIVNLDFRKVLSYEKKERARIFSGLFEAAKLVSKRKAPFRITSMAKNKWEIRSPSELISFGKILGLKENEIKNSLRK